MKVSSVLNDKQRIAPTCYHVLHQVPVTVVHEMNYLYDEGLRTAEACLAYRDKNCFTPLWKRGARGDFSKRRHALNKVDHSNKTPATTHPNPPRSPFSKGG